MAAASLDVTLRRKTPRASSFRSPVTPDPPRPPVKGTSPTSRVFSKIRSPKASRVILSHDDSGIATGEHQSYDYLDVSLDAGNDMTSPFYDPSLKQSYYDQCYEQLEALGSGSYATVYEARSVEDGTHYAIKRSSRRFTSTADRKRKIEEMFVAKHIGEHPQLVKYYDAWEEDGQLFIKMELCSGGSLKEYAVTHPLTEETLWSFFYDIVKGLEHIHAQGYTHFDIKPANIFVMHDASLKIGDFGIAVNHVNYGCTRRTERDDGDPIYIAPELLKTDYVGPAVDIFSAGMTMLDLVSGRELPGNGPDWHLLREGSLPRNLFGDVSSEMASLIQTMLSPDHLERPTAAAILNHPAMVRVARRRLALSIVTRPYATLMAVLRYLMACVLAVLASMAKAPPPPDSPPRPHRRETRVASPLPFSSGRGGGGSVDDPPPPEPVRTRLVFDDAVAGDTDWDTGRRLNHRLVSPTADRSLMRNRNFRIALFSEDEG
eukprot:m.30799 g.30799  ORF g.30799 m.30799 type:complete len:489 (-) comp6839_c0_seq1:945-2411(-)